MEVLKGKKIRVTLKMMFLVKLIFAFNSCNQKKSIEEYLIGYRWQVVEMNYKGKDYEPFLVFSSFVFEIDNKCSTPLVKIKKGFLNKKNRFAEWKLLSSNRIRIKNNFEKYFNGEFDVCFSKDVNSKSVDLILSSKDLHIKAYRLFSKGYNESLPIKCKGYD